MRHPRSESGSASNAAKKPVIFLLGPTAVGKSELGLALAHRIDAEIISADSMQIYRGMDIGTAKPSKQARFRVRHHLLDLRAPSREFSAHEYRLKALHALQVISSRGKMPLVIGGSGLYVRALIEGLSGQPGKNTAYRRRLEAEIKVRGIARLYRRLEKIDAATASSIDPRNQRRVIRALEIYQQSKQAPTAWYRNRETLEFLGYQPILFGLERDREVLYDRINQRVDKMFRRGLVAEVKRLVKKKVSKTARQAVGYKEIGQALQESRRRGLKADWKESKDLIKRNTRRLAKRQITWFRKERNIRWIQCGDWNDLNDLCDEIFDRFRGCLSSQTYSA